MESLRAAHNLKKQQQQKKGFIEYGVTQGRAQPDLNKV